MGRERTRLQAAGEMAVMLSGTLSGYFSLPVMPSIAGLSVLLLAVSNRGQHAALGDQFPMRPRYGVVGLSVASHLALNVLALAGCHVVGRAVGWVFG